MQQLHPGRCRLGLLPLPGPFPAPGAPCCCLLCSLLTSASSLMCTLLYITTHCLLLQCSLATHLAMLRCAERVHPSPLRGLFVSLCTSSVYLSSGAAFEGRDMWPATMVVQCRLFGVLPACPHSAGQCSVAGSGGVAAQVALCSCLPGCSVRDSPG